MPAQWSDRQLELLQTQWRDESVSLRDIAASINNETGAAFSRNAVAGQARRLGLPLRRAPNRSSGPRPPSARPVTRIVPVNLQRRKARALARAAVPRAPVTGVPENIVHPNEPAHLGLTLFDLTDATCRYPRGEERFTFCGQQAEPDSAYCSFHRRLCYAPRERNVSATQRRAA